MNKYLAALKDRLSLEAANPALPELPGRAFGSSDSPVVSTSSKYRTGVSAANAPHVEAATAFRWRVQYPGLPVKEVCIIPEPTLDEVAMIYSGATIEPLPELPEGLVAATEVLEAEALRHDPRDDRRRCIDCMNLTAKGRCLAAARGELTTVASRKYSPVRDVPRRCEGYRPNAMDADRRCGHERWPGLTKSSDIPAASASAWGGRRKGLAE